MPCSSPPKNQARAKTLTFPSPKDKLLIAVTPCGANLLAAYKRRCSRGFDSIIHSMSARALPETPAPAPAVRIADWLISASLLEKANGDERKDAYGFIFLECFSQFRAREIPASSVLFRGEEEEEM
ncbi:hypothetical protein GW17_00033833 [Ensete ventricosum]|nr:hypothetical protein GW17_00033833 [Ensete ventricosum]